MLFVGSFALDSSQALYEISNVLKKYEQNRIGNIQNRIQKKQTIRTNQVNRIPIVNRDTKANKTQRTKQRKSGGNLRGGFTGFVNHSAEKTKYH